MYNDKVVNVCDYPYRRYAYPVSMNEQVVRQKPGTRRRVIRVRTLTNSPWTGNGANSLPDDVTDGRQKKRTRRRRYANGQIQVLQFINVNRARGR